MEQINEEHVASWVGRSEESEDVISVEQALRMAALLDRDIPPSEGDELPALWHWAYFAPRARQSQIDVDGHPFRGGFLPPIALPRRMWAGSRLRFLAPLQIGQNVTKRSEILSVEQKTGSQGKLVFVTVRHRISNTLGVAIDEEQDIVYREAGPAAATPTGSADCVGQPAWSETLNPDSTMLFRYSALTYNAHRIHYDLPYATEVESYPGLVVQGPMMATLLLSAWMRQTGGKATVFRFRGRAPLFADRPVRLCGRPGGTLGSHDLWAEGQGGYTAMTAGVSTEKA